MCSKRRKIQDEPGELAKEDLNLDLFSPSRKRDPRPNAFMGIAGVQPSGCAPPSLIRGHFSSAAEHARAAAEVFPTSE